MVNPISRNDEHSAAPFSLIEPEQRFKLIANYPLFSQLKPHDIEALSKMAVEVQYKAGEEIVKEGDFIDSFFLIYKGKAEVNQKKIVEHHAEEVILAVLTEGDSIGLSSQGFFSPHGRRTATAIAITDLIMLRINTTSFYEFIKDHLHFNTKLKELTELSLKLNFIKQTYPFIILNHDEIYSLIQKIKQISVAPGTVIFNQGEIGEFCYLIKSGSVEIFLPEHDGKEHRLAVLESSNLLGEAALLTNKPRNASSRALTETQLFVLERHLLMELLATSKTFSQTMVGFLVNRFRPIQNKDVIVHHGEKNGQNVVMLQNPHHQLYYRLSEEGWFIWKQLDGIQTVHDITINFFRKYKALVPEMICNLLYSLAETGFVEIPEITAPIFSAKPKTRLDNIKSKIKQIFQLEFFFVNTDKWLSTLYQKGMFLFYVLPVQVLLTLVSVFGLIAFVRSYPSIIEIAQTNPPNFWLFLLFLIPISTFTVLLHEAGHAFTAKNLGYKVQRMGVGWLNFGPFAYVDTSELWFADRRKRFAVNIAGVYVDLLVAGCFAILANYLSHAPLAPYLWLYSLIIYFNVYKNLNPIKEFDGYFILSDLFDSMRLRKISLRFAVAHLPHIFKEKMIIKNHMTEILYWFICIVYLVLAVVLLFLVLQTLFNVFQVLTLFSIPVLYISLGFAIFALLMSVLNIWREIRQYMLQH